MKRTIHFISGLPRSGSTLLCNVLAQNPRFHTTSTSGILDVMQLVKNRWDKLLEFQGEKNGETRTRVLQAILERYHDDPTSDKPIIFDKSRGWMGHLDLAEEALGRKIKVLVSVRDIRDCIASFERLWRKNMYNRQLAQEHTNFFKFQFIEGRCEVWMNPNQVVGSAYNNIKKALAKGYRDRLHFVEFEKLTADPRGTMEKVYEFLEEPYFKHDFNHIEQVTHEDDEMHGIPELHIIRPKIEPVEPQWPKYLGKAADKYASFNEVWQKLDAAPVSPVAEALKGKA